jgi:hypothetical protein
MWSIDEVRLWHGGEMISPARSWHLDAFPNPWDIGLAFDGIVGTRWRSWEALRPGMAIGIRFGSPREIDRVEIVSLDAQWLSQMALRILTDDGRWLEPPGAWQANPPADARKEATRELKREGVHFVAISKDGYDSKEFMEDPAGWGLRPVASSKNSTLYRID